MWLYKILIVSLLGSPRCHCMHLLLSSEKFPLSGFQYLQKSCIVEDYYLKRVTSDIFKSKISLIHFKNLSRMLCEPRSKFRIFNVGKSFNIASFPVGR